ncbi:MAG: hypothetical protein O2840_04435 [bacterium]|nr:hypothetical protein [bacterium]
MRNARNVQFELFVKLREIKQAAAALEGINNLPPKERKAWAEQYGRLVYTAFNHFIDDSNSVLRDVSFDSSTMQLSQELVISLRDTLVAVQQILPEDKKKLRS